MKPTKEQVSMSLDMNVMRDIKYLAERDDRKVSQYVNLVLKRHVERLRKQHPEYFENQGK